MKISKEQLGKIYPAALKQGRLTEDVLEGLNCTLTKYNINTPLRIAAFLSQIAVESCELKYVKELGNSEYLSKYDTGRLAERLGNTPEADGDGQKYRGRGYIQVTGRDNYRSCGKALGLDLLQSPELLEKPIYAWQSAGWYWNSRRLNTIADTGDIKAITKKVNGGYNGLEERTKYFNKAKEILGV